MTIERKGQRFIERERARVTLEWERAKQNTHTQTHMEDKEVERVAETNKEERESDRERAEQS